METDSPAEKPEELTLSPEAQQALIGYLHLSSGIGRQALAELIVSQGNSAELAGRLTARPEFQIPSV